MVAERGTMNKRFFLCYFGTPCRDRGLFSCYMQVAVVAENEEMALAMCEATYPDILGRDVGEWRVSEVTGMRLV
uniref:Uncharacterized protein n=1 Tax=Candidatus Kentrum sp. LFY TaxID=2126342 RepID=A0A450UE87_9GAMM|nr:MAG: hypothetical protein BECKLFY1418A_GA0070994_101338 [Candidatus Kentron sp. LFY]